MEMEGDEVVDVVKAEKGQRSPKRQKGRGRKKEERPRSTDTSKHMHRRCVSHVTLDHTLYFYFFFVFLTCRLLRFSINKHSIAQLHMKNNEEKGSSFTIELYPRPLAIH